MFIDILVLVLFSLFVIYIFVSFILIIRYKKVYATNKYLLKVYRNINRKVFAIDRNFYFYYDGKAKIDALADMFIELEQEVRDVEKNLEVFY